MSTRSTFGILDKSNKIKVFYCHHDGYREGVGSYLLRNVHSIEDMKKLMAAGHRSAIEPKYAYEDEDDHLIPWCFDSVQELSDWLHWDTDTEYCYLWDEAAGKLIYTEVRCARGAADDEPWCRWDPFLDLAERMKNQAVVVRDLPACRPKRLYSISITPMVPYELDEETGEQLYRPDYDRVEFNKRTCDEHTAKTYGRWLLAKKPKDEPYLLEINYITEQGDNSEDTIISETNMSVPR